MSNNLPGCFGSPLCCSPAKIPCSKCAFVANCREQSEARAARLKERYGLNAIMGRESVRLKRAAASLPEQTSSVTKSKAVELRETLKRKGIDIPRAVSMGVNPFDRNPPAYMRIAVDELMTTELTKDNLQRRYVKELNWTEQVASWHADVAIEALSDVEAKEEA